MMGPENVTLVVKAPNQQIEDQNIQCESSWTVRQLKGHLSEVYPSKPKITEQKIIYSGQLLDDNAVLKDILRKYESQLHHTMHLVCSPRHNFFASKPVVKENVAVPAPQEEGLRHRNPQPTEPLRPEMRQNDQNHTVEMQNYINSLANNYGRVPPYPDANFGLPLPTDPAALANHMVVMQQAYMQYMRHVANMWQPGVNQVTTNQPTNEPNERPVQPAIPPQEDILARDWLDYMYAGSRLAILFSVLYLYSSPFRLLLVVMIAAVGYLYQIGFFQDLAVNPAVNENQRNQEPVQQNQNREQAPVTPIPEQQLNQNQQEPVQNPPEPVQNPPEPVPNPPETNNAVNNNDNQSMFAVTWMIFSSFFASLIPDLNQ